MIQTVTRRHICFASIIEGDLATPQRQQCEAALFAKLSDARVGISMVAVHDGGCAFAVDEYDLTDVRKAVESLNVALSLRMRCARITLSGRDMSRRTVSYFIAAIAKQEIATIHVSAGITDVSVLVADCDASRTRAVVLQSVTALSFGGG